MDGLAALWVNERWMELNSKLDLILKGQEEIMANLAKLQESDNLLVQAINGAIDVIAKQDELLAAKDNSADQGEIDTITGDLDSARTKLQAVLDTHKTASTGTTATTGSSTEPVGSTV